MEIGVANASKLIPSATNETVYVYSRNWTPQKQQTLISQREKAITINKLTPGSGIANSLHLYQSWKMPFRMPIVWLFYFCFNFSSLEFCSIGSSFPLLAYLRKSFGFSMLLFSWSLVRLPASVSFISFGCNAIYCIYATLRVYIDLLAYFLLFGRRC